MSATRRITAGVLFCLALTIAAWSLGQDSPDSSTPSASPSDQQAADAENDRNGEPETSPSDGTPTGSDDEPEANAERSGGGAPVPMAVEPSDPPSSRRQGFIASLTIFVLAVFVGFEVITKVPPTLHTPLMSGSNAISGITLVGAVIVASEVVAGVSATMSLFARILGLIAVILATINAVGGFFVTHRMLAMFRRK